jgi:hypothetical protein
VRGYFRSDGTYVQPHHRTAPDHNPFNDYSTYPNINPYTGQPGTRDPYDVQREYRTPSPLYPDYTPRSRQRWP